MPNELTKIKTSLLINNNKIMMTVEQRRQHQHQQQQQNDEQCHRQRRQLLRRRKRTMTNSQFLLLTTVMCLECSVISGSSSSSSSWPPPPPPFSTPPQPTTTTTTTTKQAPSSSSAPHLPEDNPLLSRLEASIFAESALVDKESGRIYWEGGCRSTLSASLVPHLQRFGFSIHMRSMILSCFLLLAVLGAVSSWLRFKLLQECEMFHTLVSNSRHSYCSSIVLFIIDRLLLGMPKINKLFIITIIILYLVESYTCETHDYLRNAIPINSPHGVQDYIERIRQEPPHVHWKVQSFHYVPSTPLEALQRFISFRNISTRWWWWHHYFGGGGKNHSHVDNKSIDTSSSDDNDDDTSTLVLYSPNKRKRVTERATGSYQYKHWQDKTIAGIWQRAQSLSSSIGSRSRSSSSSSSSSYDHPAPFAKIVLTKLLVLADKKTRLDYFQQQAAFVTKHNQQQQHAMDEFAEFSTHINVAGFQPRLLAVRPQHNNNCCGGWHVNKIFRLHYFWLFTLLGLTLPYRIWFNRHCDELRVTVVKETSMTATVPISSSSSSSSSHVLSRGWFSHTKAHQQHGGGAIENFHELMERLQLYTKQDDDSSAITSSISQQEQESSVAEIEEAIQAADLLKEKLITTQTTLQPPPAAGGGDDDNGTTSLDAARRSGSTSRKLLRAGSTTSRQAKNSSFGNNDERRSHDSNMMMDTNDADSSSNATSTTTRGFWW